MRLAILICAELEWKAIKSILKVDKARLNHQPYGQFFEYKIGRHKSLFFQSGATKTRAAAACQFAIDRWNPQVVINLGTCGGISENIKSNTVILAKRTFQYDVLQKFGKPSPKFKRSLVTELDLRWLNLDKNSGRIVKGIIASADQDLDHEKRISLKEKEASAADWESASIAAVCKSNGTRCLILRGVTDIPSKKGISGLIDQELDYRRNTKIIMKDLLDLISKFDLCE